MLINEGLADNISKTAAENGFTYNINGNSTEFGWKLNPGYPAILWTNETYTILEECVGIRFNDIEVIVDNEGNVSTLFREEADDDVGEDDGLAEPTSSFEKVPVHSQKIALDGATIIDAREHYPNAVIVGADPEGS